MADSLMLQDFPHGSDEDPDVEPEGNVIHVPDVEAEPLAPSQGVSSIHLRPARYSGSYGVPPRLFRSVPFEILYEQGAGADETHVAPQDVQELGQFIQAEPAKHPSEPGQALCVRMSDPGSIYDLVYAYGYAVATNAVPSP